MEQDHGGLRARGRALRGGADLQLQHQPVQVGQRLPGKQSGAQTKGKKAEYE